MAKKSRLVVLISGNGSNLQAILDACADGSLPAQVVAVFSNQPEAFGLSRARKAGVPAFSLPKQEGESRQDYDRRLAELVRKQNPDWIVLAGWMRILSMTFLGCFPGRVINLHPALPGTFPGTHAIERAYEAWGKGEIEKTGVMVHFVPDEGVDVGPVLGVEEIRFMPGESLQQFEARVHEVEHRLLLKSLAEAIGLFSNP
jgi:phosphoribosylglycinamide formyltransferase-1